MCFPNAKKMDEAHTKPDSSVQSNNPTKKPGWFI